MLGYSADQRPTVRSPFNEPAFLASVRREGRLKRRIEKDTVRLINSRLEPQRALLAYRIVVCCAALAEANLNPPDEYAFSVAKRRIKRVSAYEKQRCGALKAYLFLILEGARVGEAQGLMGALWPVQQPLARQIARSHWCAFFEVVQLGLCSYRVRDDWAFVSGRTLRRHLH